MYDEQGQAFLVTPGGASERLSELSADEFRRAIVLLKNKSLFQ